MDILNISGCIVVFSGVIFYKILLYFGKLEKEKITKGEYGRADSLAATLEDSELSAEDDSLNKNFGILDEEEEETFLTDNKVSWSFGLGCGSYAFKPVVEFL